MSSVAIPSDTCMQVTPSSAFNRSADRAGIGMPRVRSHTALTLLSVDAARRRLEDLLQAQQQLERLLLPES